MLNKKTRRAFMKETAALGAGLWAAGGLNAQESKSPNEKIRFACIGIGGKGGGDSEDAVKSGDVVAICDIDDQKLGNDAAQKKFPNAKRFTDYRKMFDEYAGSIDAVTVSTPDHHHFLASCLALKAGKHCFTQKPLTHSVWEARTLANLAREKKLATQMGNQGTSEPALRQAAALVKAGGLGTIKEVHVWTNRPIWPQGGPRPKPADKIPENIHWEEFVGPAPFREFAPGYHSFSWRGWWDFGTGALGDMACHTFNMPFMAADLKNPISIEAEHADQEDGYHDSYPSWSVIKFQFPSTDKRPAIPVTWYDGGKLPSRELFGANFAGKVPASGCLIVGDKDTLHAHGDYCKTFSLLSGASNPKVDFVESPGHFVEFARAIRGGEQPVSNFPNYAGPLTETILLGNLAVWAGKSSQSGGKLIQWDAAALKATNAPEVASVIKREYRSGWSI